MGTVALLAGVAAAGVHVLGDPSKAAPSAVIRLAEASGHGDGPLRADLSEVVVVDPSLDAELHAETDPAAPPGVEPGTPAPPSNNGLVTATLIESAPEKAKPLPKAPLPGLTRGGPNGQLPVIGPNGLTSFQAYRKPFTGDPKKPAIAVVVGGLGFNARSTEQAIAELPAEVTLSFVPYAQGLQGWIDRARADGHEVLLEVPMEPFDIEANDTGPQTLMVAGDARENVAKLENLLSRGVGYFAVTNYQGQKFAASAQASAPVVKALKERGLGFFGAGVNGRAGLAGEAMRAQLTFAAADRILDVRRDAEAIDEQLLNLEALALQNGSALGSGFAYPVTIEQVRYWADQVEDRGYVLAPASAVMERRSAPR